MPLLLGIIGSTGVGKDEMAQHLQAHYGMVRVALADPIKQVAKDIFGFSNEALWGPSHLRNQPDTRYRREDGSYLTPREVLQLLGTELGRTCYKNIWVEKALATAEVLLDNDPHTFYDPPVGIFYNSYGQADVQGVVISDVRFANEVQAIQDKGGIIVRIKRQTQHDPTKVGLANHASEVEQLSIPDSALDEIINAEEGLTNFHRQIDAFAVAHGLVRVPNGVGPFQQ